jgi:predicted nucleotidyltransferase
MNLSEPLEGLTSPVAAACLRVLARSEAGFSGRQVHALARVGSTSSVHRALRDLVDVGILTATAQPPAIVYRANRRHVLWPAVATALDARSRFFQDIRAFCLQQFPHELELTVIVYGSVARRESTAESDVDVLVVYPDRINPEERAEFDYRISGHVGEITGNECQVFSIERGEFERRITERDPFIHNVLGDGQIVVSPNDAEGVA